MTDLIDRAVLRDVIESFLGRCPKAEKPWEHGYDCALTWVLRRIDAASAISCEECKHRQAGPYIDRCDFTCHCGEYFERRQ